MKFKLNEEEKVSRSWVGSRYCIVIQKTAGEHSDTYVVYVGVDDNKTGEFDVVYPRFEGHGLQNMGAVAETLVREMAKLKEDVALSKVEKLLNVVKKRLYDAYQAFKTADPALYKKLGINPDDNVSPMGIIHG